MPQASLVCTMVLSHGGVEPPPFSSLVVPRRVMASGYYASYRLSRP